MSVILIAACGTFEIVYVSLRHSCPDVTETSRALMEKRGHLFPSVAQFQVWMSLTGTNNPVCRDLCMNLKLIMIPASLPFPTHPAACSSSLPVHIYAAKLFLKPLKPQFGALKGAVWGRGAAEKRLSTGRQVLLKV